MAYPRQPTTLSPLPSPPPLLRPKWTIPSASRFIVSPQSCLSTSAFVSIARFSSSSLHDLQPILLSRISRGLEIGLAWEESRRRVLIFVPLRLGSKLNFERCLGFRGMEGRWRSEHGGLRREKAEIIRGRPRKVSSPPGERFHEAQRWKLTFSLTH